MKGCSSRTDRSGRSLARECDDVIREAHLAACVARLRDAAVIVAQRAAGNCSIIGFMLESNIGWGKQTFSPGARDLAYGVSTTDACMNWDSTAALLRRLHATLG